jgi:hypothetical protein
MPRRPKVHVVGTVVDWDVLPPQDKSSAGTYPPRGPFKVVASRKVETYLCDCGVRLVNPTHKITENCGSRLVYLSKSHYEVQITINGVIVENRFRSIDTGWWPITHFRVVDEEAAA